MRASRYSALLVSQRLLTPEEVLQTVHQTHGRSVGGSYGVRGGGRSVQAVGGGERHRMEAVRGPDEREQQVREAHRHLGRRVSAGAGGGREEISPWGDTARDAAVAAIRQDKAGRVRSPLTAAALAPSLYLSFRPQLAAF